MSRNYNAFMRLIDNISNRNQFTRILLTNLDKPYIKYMYFNIITKIEQHL